MSTTILGNNGALLKSSMSTMCFIYKRLNWVTCNNSFGLSWKHAANVVILARSQREKKPRKIWSFFDLSVYFICLSLFSSFVYYTFSQVGTISNILWHAFIVNILFIIMYTDFPINYNFNLKSYSIRIYAVFLISQNR